ncbi:MAG: hypothetical protein J0652_02485 [Desulfobulbaceae bacterium]|nr:hypothetical protein [Desulfobulbaceae bacterium]
MENERMKTNFFHLTVLAVIINLSFCIAGCGPSLEERQTKELKEMVDRKKMIRNDEEKEKTVINQVVKKYNAIYFRPEDIGIDAFTVEYQEFFKAHSQDPILFQGYLEDIEETQNGTFVEFLCLHGEMYPVDKKAIRFRLKISDSYLKILLNRKQTNPDLDAFRYMSAPEYYVVAKIENTASSHLYQFEAETNDKEVRIQSGVSRNLIATGQLIGAEAIPKNIQ